VRQTHLVCSYQKREEKGKVRLKRRRNLRGRKNEKAQTGKERKKEPFLSLGFFGGGGDFMEIGS